MSLRECSILLLQLREQPHSRSRSPPGPRGLEERDLSLGEVRGSTWPIEMAPIASPSRSMGTLAALAGRQRGPETRAYSGSLDVGNVHRHASRMARPAMLLRSGASETSAAWRQGFSRAPRLRGHVEHRPVQAQHRRERRVAETRALRAIASNTG
jgi:hypothetical protein